MQSQVKIIIQNLVAIQREDFDRRKDALKRVYSKIDRIEKLRALREDWAEKRLMSILREAGRAGVTLDW